MCGIGTPPGRRDLRGIRARSSATCLALLGWAGGLRDHLAVGDFVIADRALSAGRSDVNCLALPLPGLARVRPRPGADRRPRRRCAGSQAFRRGVRCAGRGNGSLPAGSLGCAARGAICAWSCDSRHGRRQHCRSWTGCWTATAACKSGLCWERSRGGRPCWANSLAWRSDCAGSTGAWPSWQSLRCPVKPGPYRRQPSLSVRSWRPRPTLATPSGLHHPTPRAMHSMFGRRMWRLTHESSAFAVSRNTHGWPACGARLEPILAPQGFGQPIELGVLSEAGHQLLPRAAPEQHRVLQRAANSLPRQIAFAALGEPGVACVIEQHRVSGWIQVDRWGAHTPPGCCARVGSYSLSVVGRLSISNTP